MQYAGLPIDLNQILTKYLTYANRVRSKRSTGLRKHIHGERGKKICDRKMLALAG